MKTTRLILNISISSTLFASLQYLSYSSDCPGTYRDSSGVKRFVGLKDGLKKSGFGPKSYTYYNSLYPATLALRAYPAGLGHHLLKVWREVKDLPRKSMREKPVVSTTATDRELFEQMEVGDVWAEAELIQVWSYLYRNRNLTIPESWQSTMKSFNSTLMDIVSQLAYTCMND